MAFDVEYTIEAIDKFSGTAKRIEKSVGRLDKKVDGFAKRSVKRFRNVSAGFAGIFTLGAAAIAGRALTRVGGRFEDQLADLSAITGATGKDLDLLKGKAFEMGKEFADSGSNVLEAFKLVGSAKAELLGNLPALIETTKEVLKLKNASGIDLASAAMFTAESLNIFGKGADQAGRFVNVLAAGAKEGASEVMDTGEAMKVAGPLASKLGLSFEKVNALLQGIAQGGIKGRMAGTGLQGVLARLSKEGVDFSKVGLSDLFLKIGDAIEGQIDPAKKAKLVQRLFGLEHQKTGLTLVSQARSLDILTRKLTGTNVAQEQASIRLATFNSKMRQIGVTIEEKVVALFERLAPDIERVATQFGTFIDNLEGSDIDSFAKSLGIVADAIVLIAKFGAGAVNALAGVGGAIGRGAAQTVLGTTGEFDPTAQFGRDVAAFQGAGGGTPSQVEIILSGNTEFVSEVKPKPGSNTQLKVGRNMSTL